jgi:hypothetical protein
MNLIGRLTELAAEIPDVVEFNRANREADFMNQHIDELNDTEEALSQKHLGKARSELDDEELLRVHQAARVHVGLKHGYFKLGGSVLKK